MRTTRRSRRRGLASLALSLALLLGVAPTAAAQDEDEEGAKNLSTPVILADDASPASAFATLDPPVAPPFIEGNADYTDATGDYYTGHSDETYAAAGGDLAALADQEFDADVWGAEWVAELESPVPTDVKWGDNLMSAPLSGGGQPVRVEVNLFADDPDSYDLQGYPTVSLGGTMRTELFGTNGQADVIPPMVFTPKATLTIMKYSPTTGEYSVVDYGEQPMGFEVNASGKLIYGHNWRPQSGNYRLIFQVHDSLVTFVDALTGEDGEEATRIPLLASDTIAYIDVNVGVPAIEPPLPFEIAPAIPWDRLGAAAPSAGTGILLARADDAAPVAVPWADATGLGDATATAGLTPYAPAISMRSDGRADGVVVGTNGLLYTAVRATDGTWSGWSRIPGSPVVAGRPAAVSTGTSRLDVYAATPNGMVHLRRIGGTWAGPFALGGRVDPGTGVAATDLADGRQLLVVRGTDASAWGKVLTLSTGRWSGWADHGGILLGEPTVATHAAGAGNVVVRGRDNAVWTVAVYGTTSKTWYSLGGAVTDPPVIFAKLGSRRLDIMARGIDGALFHKDWTGSWSAWERVS